MYYIVSMNKEIKQIETIKIRVTEQDKKEMLEEARRDNRTLSNYIVNLFKTTIESK